MVSDKFTVIFDKSFLYVAGLSISLLLVNSTALTSVVLTSGVWLTGSIVWESVITFDWLLALLMWIIP